MNKQLIINILNKKDVEINENIFLKIRDRAIFEGKNLRKELDIFVRKYTDEKIDFKEDRSLKYFVNNIYFKQNKLSRVSRKAIEDIAEETGEQVFHAINRYRELANKVDRLNKLGKVIKKVEYESYGKKKTKPVVKLSFDYNSGGYIYNTDQLLKFSREETMLIFDCHSIQMGSAEEVMEVITDIKKYGYTFIFAIGNTVYYQVDAFDINGQFERKYKQYSKKLYLAESEFEEQETEEYKEEQYKKYIKSKNFFKIDKNIEEFIEEYSEIIDYFIEENKLYFVIKDHICPVLYTEEEQIKIAKLIKKCLAELDSIGANNNKIIEEIDKHSFSFALIPQEIENNITKQIKEVGAIKDKWNNFFNYLNQKTLQTT
ncbi:hypothetical protein SAMN05661008_00348 [Alkalithermobacter thermoalcaliphilus JW-YL-7 = DSM 7308]|uniref:Uncharacterized protein n=1 Tax=Alkalithermobacter thermoalcaliphilus JW-YL-7 = DSM 7308 TaxID=1121328 RepID=A0A150FQI5_CLOPD|nr:hypothetical protein JWYL7_0540 [[Clostridium] paradoxum JW-YL-7 = DSM 7308]SHK50591.1 hypothetical protein SAMN05661008_00348 [[Clostridium] paradoxum JW-YL-7 = DSM 7308]